MQKYTIPLVIVFAFTACSKDTPSGPSRAPGVMLSPFRVEAVEVALNVSFTDNAGARVLELRRDGISLFSGQVAAAETTLVDTTVLPARTYLYHAIDLQAGRAVDSSDVLSLTTLDTTSHDYVWDIQTIGGFQSSLSDVWGSAADDVWSVGRITPAEPNTRSFNLTHFDGVSWELDRLIFAHNPQATVVPQLGGIHGFSRDNIWIVGVNGIIFHWDGRQWLSTCLGLGGNCSGLLADGQQLTAIWGPSSSELFAVGAGGVIVHSDGDKWQRMESGTDLTLRDVWGLSTSDVYCVGADLFGGQGIVLHYDGEQWQQVSIRNGETLRRFGIWGLNRNYLITTGDFTYRFDGQSWRELPAPDLNIVKQKVFGTAINDVFIIGDFGLLLHWNGETWRRYDDVSFDGSLRGLWTDGREIVAVGWNSAFGVIIRGQLQQLTMLK